MLPSPPWATIGSENNKSKESLANVWDDGNYVSYVAWLCFWDMQRLLSQQAAKQRAAAAASEESPAAAAAKAALMLQRLQQHLIRSAACVYVRMRALASCTSTTRTHARTNAIAHHAHHIGFIFLGQTTKLRNCTSHFPMTHAELGQLPTKIMQGRMCTSERACALKLPQCSATCPKLRPHWSAKRILYNIFEKHIARTKSSRHHFADGPPEIQLGMLGDVSRRLFCHRSWCPSWCTI